jgi:molybdate transport system permease protein
MRKYGFTLPGETPILTQQLRSYDRWLVAAGDLAVGYLRALGDFGATLMVAGNIPGRTQTLSMAVYDAVQANDIQRANVWVLALSLLAFSFLAIVLRLNRQVTGEGTS